MTIEPVQLARDSILEIQYHNFPKSLTTTCLIITSKRCEFIGYTHCASKDKFSLVIGQALAFENAFNKLVEFEVLKMKEKS